MKEHKRNITGNEGNQRKIKENQRTDQKIQENDGHRPVFVFVQLSRGGFFQLRAFQRTIKENKRNRKENK